jgi:hypothetical protein
MLDITEKELARTLHDEDYRMHDGNVYYSAVYDNMAEKVMQLIRRKELESALDVQIRIKHLEGDVARLREWANMPWLKRLFR